MGPSDKKDDEAVFNGRRIILLTFFPVSNRSQVLKSEIPMKQKPQRIWTIGQSTIQR
jgi:hypothetical protein